MHVAIDIDSSYVLDQLKSIGNMPLEHEFEDAKSTRAPIRTD